MSNLDNNALDELNQNMLAEDESIRLKKVKELADILIENRKKTKLSQQELADKLIVPLSVIIALESGNYNELPSVIYVKGFFNKIVTFYKLDKSGVVDLFNSILVEKKDAVDEEKINKINDNKVSGSILTKTRFQKAEKFYALFGIFFFITISISISFYLYNVQESKNTSNNIAPNDNIDNIIEKNEDIDQVVIELDKEESNIDLAKIKKDKNLKEVKKNNEDEKLEIAEKPEINNLTKLKELINKEKDLNEQIINENINIESVVEEKVVTKDDLETINLQQDKKKELSSQILNNKVLNIISDLEKTNSVENLGTSIVDNEKSKLSNKKEILEVKKNELNNKKEVIAGRENDLGNKKEVVKSGESELSINNELGYLDFNVEELDNSNNNNNNNINEKKYGRFLNGINNTNLNVYVDIIKDISKGISLTSNLLIFFKSSTWIELKYGDIVLVKGNAKSDDYLDLDLVGEISLFVGDHNAIDSIYYLGRKINFNKYIDNLGFLVMKLAPWFKL